MSTMAKLKHTAKRILRKAPATSSNQPAIFRDDFLSVEERKTGKLLPSTINFFHTFGFLKINRFFKSDYQEISTEFDRVMHEKFGELQERFYLYPQFMDQSRYLTSILESEKVNNLVDSLLGPGAIYKGSDANLFVHGSAWHRDYLNRIKSIKVLSYLEPNDLDSGALRFIPGSHFVDSAFSQFLTAGLAWPEVPTNGGFDEKAFFPLGNSPVVSGGNTFLPQVAVTNEPGDIIIFNHNIVHCVNTPHSYKKRRLMAFAFSANLLHTRPQDPQSAKLMEETKKVSELELGAFALPRMYGKYVLETQSPNLKPRIEFLNSISGTAKDGMDGKYRDGKNFLNNEETAEFANRFEQNRLSEFYNLN